MQLFNGAEIRWTNGNWWLPLVQAVVLSTLFKYSVFFKYPKIPKIRHFMYKPSKYKPPKYKPPKLETQKTLR